MKRVLAATVLFLTAAVLAAPAVAQIPTDLRNSNVTTEYVGWKFQGLHERLQKRQVLEQISAFLSPLRLKEKLTFEFAACNTVNAFYNLKNKVTLCYELVDWLCSHTAMPPAKLKQDPRAGAPRRGLVPGVSRPEAIIGALAGIALHEAGHAIFDIQRIPRLGREEDAADMIAGFVMLQFGNDVARVMIKGMYNLTHNWYAQRPEIPITDRSRILGDTHSLDMQRAFNFLCLAYGKEPDVFQDIGQAWLPPARRPNCATEYQQALRAFTKTVLPDIDQELMTKVRAMPILLPSDANL